MLWVSDLFPDMQAMYENVWLPMTCILQTNNPIYDLIELEKAYKR